jgi:hypothetical protein
LEEEALVRCCAALPIEWDRDQVDNLNFILLSIPGDTTHHDTWLWSIEDGEDLESCSTGICPEIGALAVPLFPSALKTPKLCMSKSQKKVLKRMQKELVGNLHGCDFESRF